MSRIQVIFSLSAVIFLCLPLISASADAATSDQVAQVFPDILGRPNSPANIAFETWRIDSGMDTLQNCRAQVANSQEAANDINDIFLKLVGRPSPAPSTAYQQWRMGLGQQTLGLFRIQTAYSAESVAYLHIVTPVNYQAAGDCQTDDTQALRNFFQVGGRLLAPPGGCYRVSDTIRVPSRVIVSGDGPSSLIKMVLPQGSPVRAVLDLSGSGLQTTSLIQLSNFAVDGGNPSVGYLAAPVSYSGNLFGCRIDGTRIRGKINFSDPEQRPQRIRLPKGKSLSDTKFPGKLKCLYEKIKDLFQPKDGTGR